MLPQKVRMLKQYLFTGSEEFDVICVTWLPLLAVVVSLERDIKETHNVTYRKVAYFSLISTFLFWSVKNKWFPKTVGMRYGQVLRS